MVENKNKAIGIFDSGLGGLTCLAQVIKTMPCENIIYFGDTARIPYGTRSRETVLEYAKQDVAFIKKHEVKMIIAACGTVSSTVGNIEDFAGDTLFTGVVLPASKVACEVTKNNKIGVIGTGTSITSGAYRKAIHNINPDIEVFDNACNLFVSLVENGLDSDDVVVKIITERYLKEIKASGVDTLILGCTHFPIISKAIGEYMGDNVTLISSGATAAEYAKEVLEEKGMLTDRTESGRVTYYTSDSVTMFEDNAHSFLGTELHGDVIKVSLDELVEGE